MLRASVRRVQPAAAPTYDVAAARLDQNKVEVARREADAARRRRSRAADATATRSNVCGVWSGLHLRVPLPSLQTTRRPHFTSRRKWRVVSLMLRAGVRRVQLMPLPRSDVLSGLCAARCVMCVGQAMAYVLCLVAPEMSGGPSLRCPYG